MTEKLIPQAVKLFGTDVIGKGERVVLELRGLDQPLDFVNPKDRGTKYGDQHLKGDGTDILILNGVSKIQELMLNKFLYRFESQTGREAAHMNADEVKKLLEWLEANKFDDRYCSDLIHKEKAYEHVRGYVYRKLTQPVKAAQLEKGQTYVDNTKTQEAAVDGALFIMDARNIGHITNVPEGYDVVKKGSGIILYKDALSLYQQMIRQQQHSA